MILERYETVLQGKAFGRIIDGIDDDSKQANGLGDHNSLAEGLGEERERMSSGRASAAIWAVLMVKYPTGTPSSVTATKVLLMESTSFLRA